MNESEKERAKLIFGDDEEIALPEKPIIDPETIRGVSARVGFPKDRRPGNTQGFGEGSSPATSCRRFAKANTP